MSLRPYWVSVKHKRGHRRLRGKTASSASVLSNHTSTSSAQNPLVLWSFVHPCARSSSRPQASHFARLQASKAVCSTVYQVERALGPAKRGSFHPSNSFHSGKSHPQSLYKPPSRWSSTSILPISLYPSLALLSSVAMQAPKLHLPQGIGVSERMFTKVLPIDSFTVEEVRRRSGSALVMGVLELIAL